MPDLVRLGRGVRALRRRRHWRQLDLAVSAGVSREHVSRIERGIGDRSSVRDLDRIAQALGARLHVRLDWNGEALDRLLDVDHARIVESVVAHLRAHEWDVANEVTFAIGQERGSVDVLAWHAETATILVVEVKSVVPDIQAMLASLDRKVRLALPIARRFGWGGASVAKLLVIGESRTSRRRVEAFRETFALQFPDRVATIRRWIATPDGRHALRGLWFLPGENRSRHRVVSPPRDTAQDG